MTSFALTSSSRVLIIGATGFVGSWLIRELLKKNVKLRLLVRDLVKAAPLIIKGADIEVVQGDLYSAVIRLLSDLIRVKRN